MYKVNVLDEGFGFQTAHNLLIHCALLKIGCVRVNILVLKSAMDMTEHIDNIYCY